MLFRMLLNEFCFLVEPKEQDTVDCLRAGSLLKTRTHSILSHNEGATSNPKPAAHHCVQPP